MVLRKTQKSHMQTQHAQWQPHTHHSRLRQTDGMKTATNDTNVSGYKEWKWMGSLSYTIFNLSFQNLSAKLSNNTTKNCYIMYLSIWLHNLQIWSMDWKPRLSFQNLSVKLIIFISVHSQSVNRDRPVVHKIRNQKGTW